MTILVTGAAGFIGAAVTRALLARGESVLGLDNLNAYYDPALKRARLQTLSAQAGFRFRQLDLADHQSILALAETEPGIDRILHLAAQAGVRYSLVDPWSYAQSNVVGHLAILEMARRLPLCRHLVYASSSSVYGGNQKLPGGVEDRVDDPLSLYAVTKRAGELMSRCYSRLYELPMTGLRFFTVYGPWGRPDMSPFLFTKAVLEGTPLTLYGDGTMRRDYTYVDDIVGGVLAALDRVPEPDGEGIAHRVYNLGSDRPIKVIDFLRRIEAICGRKAEVRQAPALSAEPEETWADITQSRADLGYAPSTPLDTGLTALVEWYGAFYRVPA